MNGQHTKQYRTKMRAPGGSVMYYSLLTDEKIKEKEAKGYEFLGNYSREVIVTDWEPYVHPSKNTERTETEEMDNVKEN